MRKAELVWVGALGIAASAWLAGTQASTIPLAAAPRRAPAPQHVAAALERAPVRDGSRRERAPEAERSERTGRIQDYALAPELRPELDRYRAARDVAEREDPLLELALSDDPAVLEFLLDELRGAGPDNREQLLDALTQYGSRDAVPELRRLAGLARTADERGALLDTADYLELPSYTEFLLSNR